MSKATQYSINDQYRIGAISRDVAQFARAVAEVTGVGARVAITAAERLVDGDKLVTASQISRNYRCGGITYDLVNEAIEG